MSKEHPYGRFNETFDIFRSASLLRSLYSNRGYPERGAGRTFRILVLQVLEDVSDRRTARLTVPNLAPKWSDSYMVLGSARGRQIIHFPVTFASLPGRRG